MRRPQNIESCVLHLPDKFPERIAMLCIQGSIMTTPHPFVGGHPHKSYPTRFQHSPYLLQRKIIGACTGQLNQNVKTGNDIADAPAWRENKRRPAPLETSLPGIFAAGDVRSGSVKRCAAAVGEGGMAVSGIHLSLASRRNASTKATASP